MRVEVPYPKPRRASSSETLFLFGIAVAPSILTLGILAFFALAVWRLP